MQNSSKEELRKIVEDSIRHARANVGYTLHSHEGAEENISMNVETIMAAVTQAFDAVRPKTVKGVNGVTLEEVPSDYWNGYNQALIDLDENVRKYLEGSK